MPDLNEMNRDQMAQKALDKQAETNKQLGEINKSLGQIHDQLQSIDSAIRAVVTTIATKR